MTSVAHMMSRNANKDVLCSKGFLRLIYSLVALGGGSVLDSEGSSVLPEDRCMAGCLVWLHSTMAPLA